MSERSGIVESWAGTHPGGRVLISPDFHAAANAEPTKKFHQKSGLRLNALKGIPDSRARAASTRIHSKKLL